MTSSYKIWVNELASFTSLTSISFRACNVNTHTEYHFLTKLESISIVGIVSSFFTFLTNITNINGSASDEVLMRNTESLTGLSYKNFNNHVSPSVLPCLTNLTQLSISIPANMRNESISGLTNLTDLSLAYNSGIRDSAFQRLTQLKKLSLYLTSSIDGTFASILTNLRELRISSHNANFNAQHLKRLTQLVSLELKDVTNSQMDDSIISELVNLRYLYLETDTSVTDSGLERLTNLSVLHLYPNEAITEKTLARIATYRIIRDDSWFQFGHVHHV